ncbi:hypothetical protein ACFPVY_13265 [Flavobacterium qiangtangense]|uniref:Uncharacterized protein n=1 Tax=Flavobacterium qiangtangense TaxID=1442595 RepID=A0ABW1PQF4_9FLAO
MKLKMLIFLLFLIGFSSCQEKDKDQSEQINTSDIMENKEIETLLKKQIEAGYAAERSETDYPNYTLSENDLNASNEILKGYLSSNGYKAPSNDEFGKRIETIFGRKLDFSSDKKTVFVSFTSPCQKEMKFFKNTDLDYANYISKEGNFISELFFIPEIMDYQKVFPEIAKFENDLQEETAGIKIYKWNSKTDLSRERSYNLKTVLARNKYLFNDSKADLEWLLSSDKDFLKMLVSVYGYDSEEKINKLVLNDFYSKYDKSVPKQTQKIGELFFAKDCDGNLKMRKGLLDFVKKNTTASDNRFIYALANYALVLFGGDIDKVFNEGQDPSKKFKTEEKAMIIAYIASIESPAVEKFKQENATVWNNEASVIYNVASSHPEIMVIMKKNNYYNIPNLSQIAESATAEVEAYKMHMQD